MSGTSHVAQKGMKKNLSGKKSKKKLVQKWNKKKRPKKTELESQEIAQLEIKLKQKIDPKSIKTFLDLPLSSLTTKGLKDSGFTKPTAIQTQSLIYSLAEKDVLGASKTGSGKTLAFLIPLIEKLYRLKWTKLDGLGALVITPTRELAYQIFEQLRDVGRHHDFSAGLVIGGKDLHYESRRMGECNIVICTPGRLLQHMDENPQFDAGTMKMLILDEADRCLEMGFADQMNAIVNNLPPERQTLLFSATQTRSIKDLARLSLQNPVYVSVHEHSAKATPDQLQEYYIVCDLSQKMSMLWSFVKNNARKKILVFVQCCKQAKYFTELFRRLRSPTQITALYGTLNQLRRMAIYKEFCEAERGVLFATDIAARGLDFPTVDWVLQLDCPEDWKIYNHRVGRTARNAATGSALLVLMPSEEESMMKQLRAHKFTINKEEVNPRKLLNIQRKIQANLASDPELKETAKRAFQHYIKSIYLMKDKTVFDVFALDVDAFAVSLGLAAAPRIPFLEKHMRIQAAKRRKEELNQTPTENENGDGKAVPKRQEDDKMRLMDSSDDEDGDDVITVKRKDHAIGNEGSDEEDGDQNLMPLLGRGSSKVVTKAAAVKKALKKNIQLNQKVKFDDDGEAHEDDPAIQPKASKEGQLYEGNDSSEKPGGGIDIEKARMVLKAEDAFDRKTERARIREVHKEKKRKEKELKNKRRKEQEGETGEDPGSEDQEEEDNDDGEGPNLDWLPDPDKIYGKKEPVSSDSEDEEEGSEDGSGTKRKWKPPKKPKTGTSKKARIEAEQSSDDDDLEQLQDNEALALQLLGN